VVLLSFFSFYSQIGFFSFFSVFPYMGFRLLSPLTGGNFFFCRREGFFLQTSSLLAFLRLRFPPIQELRFRNVFPINGFFFGLFAFGHRGRPPKSFSFLSSFLIVPYNKPNDLPQEKFLFPPFFRNFLNGRHFLFLGSFCGQNGWLSG